MLEEEIFMVKRKTNEVFLEQVYSAVGTEYTVLEPYTHARAKIKFKHNKCNREFLVTPHHFITDGSRCPHCFGTPRKTDKQYQYEIDKLFEKQYTLIDTYTNTDDLLLHQCNQCNECWQIRPHNLLRGYGCPRCKSSKGEKLVRAYLKQQGVSFEEQKKFSDLVDVGQLSYDFYIKDSKVLIEYQGKQHFEPTKHFGGEESFKNRQRRDKLKKEYAESKGYTLVEVPYTCTTTTELVKYLPPNIT